MTASAISAPDDAPSGAAPVRYPHTDRTRIVYVGTNIPEEIVAAHGLVPSHLTGQLLDETLKADEYLEGRYGAEFRSVLQQLLDGAADDAAAVVFDRRFRDLFYYVKEMVRLGWLPSVPPVHLFDLILTRSVDVSEFNLGQVRGLDAVLRRVAAPASGRALVDIVAEGNAWRAEVRRLLELRRLRRVSGVEAFAALGRRRSVNCAEHTVELAALNARLDSAAATLDGPTVLLATGEPLYHDRLHRAVEQAGAVVVGEDSEWGSRIAGQDVPEPSYRGLRDKYWADATGPELRPFEARSAWLADALGHYRPDLVVVWVPPSDVRFGWDVPRLADLVASAGSRVHLVRGDVLSDDGLATTSDEFEAVVNDVRSAGGTVT